ncbi:MAG: DUF5693 family protein [Fimbriimonadales bacterium]|nr:DUF5693 family protein [Fimbriimonadales bacterium]
MSERIDRWREPAFLRTAAVAAVVVLGLVGGGLRARVEARNRAVTLAAEESAVSQMAAASGLTFRRALERLRQEGLGAVVMEEETVGGWLSTNRLGFGEDGTIVCWPGAEERIARALRLRFPRSSAKPLQPGVLSAPGVPVDVLRTASLGLDAKKAKEVWSAGLTVVWRGASGPMSADGVREAVAWARELGAKAFLPLGDRVLGYRESLGDVAEALRKAGMVYVSAEFAKIAGDASMVAKAPELVVRLHAAQAAEIDKMTEREYLERYARAASERGIRMLLLRPMSDAGATPLEGFATLVGKVRRAVQAEGLPLGSAKPYEDPSSPPWLLALTGLAVASLVAVTAQAFGLGGRALACSAAALGVLGAACWVPPARPLMAFLGALAAPLLAIRTVELSPRRSAWLLYAAACGVSAAGGLAVVGLLNGLPYLVRAEQFQGVKAAHALPIVAVGVWFFLRWFDWRSVLQRPVVWVQALVAVTLLAALAFMLLRTGNDNPGAVSGIELRLRSLLDQLLLVRPRTKEVFVGHPALFVGLALWVRLGKDAGVPRLAGWVALLLTVGMIGQTSIVNTFCHLHTPFWLGVARVLVGVLVGGLIGWAIAAFLSSRLGATEQGEAADG